MKFVNFLNLCGAVYIRLEVLEIRTTKTKLSLMFAQTFADIYAKVLRDHAKINIADKLEIKKTYLKHHKLHYLNFNLKIFKKIPG